MSLEPDDVLAAIGKGKLAPLYLVWGEEFLVRKTADQLAEKLLPDAMAGINLLTMDGASPRELAQELATLPMFPGRKLVIVRDPEFLAPKKGRGDVLGRARDAWRAGRRKEASRRILALVGRAGWGPSALEIGAPGAPDLAAWKKELDVALVDADVEWLREVGAYCRDEGITAPDSDASSLVTLIDGQLPEGHLLLLAATEVDPKHPLVKLAKDQGGLIERKVAGTFKKLDLTELADAVLGPLGAKMSPGALEKLKDRCGGNMRLVQSELEKLAIYADGATIQAADVELLVGRAREEEYGELAEALQKRDLPAALRYVNEALANGSHGLLLLGAVASVVRKMLDSVGQLEKHAGGAVPRSMKDFESRIWPALEAEIKAAKGKPPHPYAAFKAMEAAGKHGRAGLLRSLRACAEADLALKSSGSGQLVMERLLWTVCGVV